MTETDKIKALVAYRIEQANDALKAAGTLIDTNLFRDAISRAYYAIFYAGLALLATRRLGASKHSGTLMLLSREFVKPGILSKEMARLARRAFERRLEADYAELVIFTREEAENTLAEARIFVQEINAILPEVLPD